MKVSLVIDSEREIKTVLARLREMIQQGRRVMVKAEFYTPKRTNAQNATMHLWFGEIADQSGHSAQEIKEILKQEFLPRKIVRIGDIETLRPVDTSGLRKAETCLFMERIQAWAAEWGFVITQPEPEILRAWRIEAEQEAACGA